MSELGEAGGADGATALSPAAVEELGASVVEELSAEVVEAEALGVRGQGRARDWLSIHNGGGLGYGIASGAELERLLPIACAQRQPSTRTPAHPNGR